MQKYAAIYGVWSLRMLAVGTIGTTEMRQLQRLNTTTRNTLMSTEDTVCLDRAQLVTAAYQRYADEP
ncbi:MAG: hypothetical protein P1S60_12040, partial [Anaerolineae bacterium]|nr:hypothetical protein [Anaerolineae bacterium]